MAKVRIYGDQSRFRTALARAIRSGDDLLAQTDGVRRRMKLVEESPVEAALIEQQWVAAFRRWFMGTGNSLVKFLQEQLNPPRNSAPEDEDVLPTLSSGLPPDDGKPRHHIALDEGEAWLSKTLDELRALAAEFPPSARSRIRTKVPAPKTRSWRDSLATHPVVIAVSLIGAVASVVGLVIVLVH